MAARITPPPPEPRSSPRLRLVGDPEHGLSELDLFALGITRVDLSDPASFGLVRERLSRG